MSAERERVHREVVSYVRRSARMNQSQQKAWTAHQDWVVRLPTRGISTSVSPDARIDWEATFGRSAPLTVEIGSGTGEAIVPIAAAHPDRDFLAFEVFEPGVASTLSRISRAGVSNVRVAVANGAEGLGVLFGPASISELWLFFPDPWHKARHHKRRLVGRALSGLVADRLAPGGLWRLATDWEDYALWMRQVLDQQPLLETQHQGWAPRWAERVETKYERRGVEAGRQIHDLSYRRV